jgi:hypothetical protein
MMKKFLTIVMAAMVALTPMITTALAAELPKKFWGTWVDATTRIDLAPMKLSSKGVTHGSGPGCYFTKVEVTNEEATAFNVDWRCPKYPKMLTVETAFALKKVGGKDTLVQVDRENPSYVSIYHRKK